VKTDFQIGGTLVANLSRVPGAVSRVPEFVRRGTAGIERSSVVISKIEEKHDSRPICIGQLQR